jgi:drug/metabolite transporter (DMT)-like permease
MPTRTRATGWELWLALGVVYVIWGSTYLGIALAIRTIPPFFMAAGRFAIAGVALIAWDLLRSREARHWPTRRQLIDSAIVGALLLGVGNGFVALGEKSVPTGIAAIIIGTMPVWFAVFGRIYFKERVGRVVALAIAIGLAGVVALVWPSGSGPNQINLAGIGILLLAELGWSHGSLYAAHKAHLPSRAFIGSGLQMLAAAVLLVVEGVLVGEPAQLHPAEISTQSILAVLYLAAFGSMLAFTTYGWLLQHAPLSLVGTYAYVNPVVAIALGTLFLGESITPRTLIASAVIVAAVAMIVTARAREGRSEGGPSDAPEPISRSEPSSSVAPFASLASWSLSRTPAPPRGSSG